MGRAVFAPSRSVLPGHAGLSAVDLDIDFTDALRRRVVRKYPHRSSDGRMETLYEGADTVWSLALAPVIGNQYLRVREFLDSTADGQTFLLYIYGSESAPLAVKRQDTGYAPQPFQRTGKAATDAFSASITVCEQ